MVSLSRCHSVFKLPQSLNIIMWKRHVFLQDLGVCITFDVSSFYNKTLTLDQSDGCNVVCIYLLFI